MPSSLASARRSPLPSRLALAVFAALSAAPLAYPAAYVWDPADTTNGTTIDAGSGTWSTAAENVVWNNAGTNVPWSQTSATSALHQAQFGGADAPEGSSYTVTVAEPVAVSTPSGTNGVWFSSNGYVLTAPSPTTVTTSRVTVSTNKSATISGPVSITPTNNGALTLGGFGLLTMRDGARLAPNANIFTVNHGSKLTLGTDGVVTTSSQIVIGPAATASATSTEVTIAGGSMTATSASTSSASNIVLGNTATPPAGGAAANLTLTLASGELSNASPLGGLRFGPATGGNALINATFNLDGGTLTTARIFEGTGASLATTSVFNFNGGTLRVVAATTNGASFLAGLNNAYVKAGGALIDTNTADVTISQPLLADPVSLGGGLTKLGEGTLTLTGANTYTGPTIVSGGSLAIAAPAALTATTVEADARLKITSGTSNSSIPALTLRADSGVVLDLGVHDSGRLATASFGAFNAPELEGEYSIDLTGTNIPVGTFTVFTYGAKTGVGTPSVGLLPPGVTATVQDTGSAIVLNVLTAQLTNYFWSAAGAGTWDTTSANWTGQTYVEGTFATFPDLNGANTVTLSAPRSPFAVAIQTSSSNSYTFEGSPIAGAATITKTGGGIATFNAANTYVGTTTISEGGVIVSVNDALGTATGGTTVAPGAFLGLGGGIAYSTLEPITGSGGGNLATVGSVLPQRGFVQSLSGHSTFAGPIVLAGSGINRFGTQDGASLTLAGPITAAPNLTEVGVLFRTGVDGDFVTLSSPGNQWDGPTLVFSGTSTGTSGLRLGVDNGIPVVSSVVGGGTSNGARMIFDLAGFDQTLNGLVNSNGYLSIQNSAEEPSVLTLDLLTEDVSQARTDTVPNLTTIHDGPGTGKVSVVKRGAFTQTLSGVHTYSGPTLIEAGTLAFTTTGTLGASPVTMGVGSTLDIATITANEFALSAGLSGSGTVTATDKTVLVSNNFTPGSLAVSGNLTLTPGIASTLIASDSAATRTALTITGALVLDGSLAINPAAGFDFGTINRLALFSAAGGVSGSFTSVTVGGQALNLASAGVWTGGDGPLSYTFTEATGTLEVAGGVGPNLLQAWRDLYFPTAGNDGTGIGALEADPDGDGLSNLLEYATGTHPTEANASAITLGTAEGKLSLTYNRTDDPSLTYTVQGRNDLATGAWTTVTAPNNPSTGGTTAVTVEDEVAITAQSRRFLRLEVTLAP